MAYVLKLILADDNNLFQIKTTQNFAIFFTETFLNLICNFKLNICLRLLIKICSNESLFIYFFINFFNERLLNTYNRFFFMISSLFLIMIPLIEYYYRIPKTTKYQSKFQNGRCVNKKSLSRIVG